MHIPAEQWRQLSHRQRRALVTKERKRWRRKEAALLREEEQATLDNDPEYLESVVQEEREKEERLRRDQARSRLEEAAWLERERRNQEAFRERREREDKILREREERERLIREEWEALQRREQEEEEKREREKKEKEERLREALTTGEKTAQRWHNPLAPDEPASGGNYGTERDSVYCSFFLKTGVCRFGDRCSRLHPRPTASPTLLIRGMYQSLGFREAVLDEQDHDTGLEYDEGDAYEQYSEFYSDVLPEFSKAGKVVQFKVSCNYEPHLRGNVYVQFSTEQECATAFGMFNGRWYAQKQLSCELCPVQRWKTAICGMFDRRQCPKGKRCNFLHVFRNPGGAFARADVDATPHHAPSERSGRSWRRTPRRSQSRSASPSSPRGRRHHRSWDRRRSASRESRSYSVRSRQRSHSRERREERRGERDGRDGGRRGSERRGSERREGERREERRERGRREPERKERERRRYSSRRESLQSERERETPQRRISTDVRAEEDTDKGEAHTQSSNGSSLDSKKKQTKPHSLRKSPASPSRKNHVSPSGEQLGSDSPNSDAASIAESVGSCSPPKQRKRSKRKKKHTRKSEKHRHKRKRRRRSSSRETVDGDGGHLDSETETTVIETEHVVEEVVHSKLAQTSNVFVSDKDSRCAPITARSAGDQQEANLGILEEACLHPRAGSPQILTEPEKLSQDSMISAAQIGQDSRSVPPEEIDQDLISAPPKEFDQDSISMASEEIGQDSMRSAASEEISQDSVPALTEVVI